MTLDPMMALAAIARGTERIGLVATGSTSFNEPYNIARQFKALDVMSHGRAGWNAVTTSDPSAAANYGQGIAPRPERYQRAHETIQIAQALWEKLGKRMPGPGTRTPGASPIPQRSGRSTFVANMSLRAVQCPFRHQNRASLFFFSAGGGENGSGLAGRYASGVIGAAFTIEDARAQRDALSTQANWISH